MSRRPCPTGKRGAYRDMGEAIGAALRASRHLGPLRIYPCPMCGLLHLSRYREWVDR